MFPNPTIFLTLGKTLTLTVCLQVLKEDADGPEQMRFLDEARWNRDATHGNVLKLLGHCIDCMPYIVILEHASGGDLKSFLISNVTKGEQLNSKGLILRMALGKIQ